MIKRILSVLCVAILIFTLGGCGKSSKTPKIGASFGIGPAARWPKEKVYMEERAKELNVDIEVRMNTGDQPKTQFDDCKELIDGGIDVLILMPRDASKVSDILSYAKEKKVKVISYARVVLGEKVDLFVGYDSNRIGQKMGQFLTELVYKGDYILLRGDVGDNNAKLLYEGAMRYIDPLRENLNILADETVAGWSADEAKKIVKEAVSANNNHVDAILAPNDAIAGACAEALTELGVTAPVAITGMDAELNATKRIVAGTQSMTIYMDLKTLASTAVDQACKMAKGETVDVNVEFDNNSGSPINANLITGQTVTKENLDDILINSHYFTWEDVYGTAK